MNSLAATTLPITPCLPDILSTLDKATRLVLIAEPGAGKTTRVPLALLDAPWLAGRRIVLLEPRRLAARAAARHMARLLGEPVGQTVGFRTALDACDSAQTRLLVVTEGILTRMLQHAPDLPHIGCIIFDEFHERSLQADLGLALSLDSQEGLRPDMRIVIMSATLDAAPLSSLLGGCPVYEAPGRSFPVCTRYVPGPQSNSPHGRHEDAVAAAIHRALTEESGSVLVFLPGAAEIHRIAARLEKLRAHVPNMAAVSVYPLFGELPPATQDAAIAPAPPDHRKIVLATNIAESSLTIEGIRVVIDSGLARRQRFDAEWGMSRLVTERVSRAEADQRRGRAGRLAPGVCWPQNG